MFCFRLRWFSDSVVCVQVEEGWWSGTLNGKSGLFPSNFVKELNSIGEDQESNDTATVETGKRNTGYILETLCCTCLFRQWDHMLKLVNRYLRHHSFNSWFFRGCFCASHSMCCTVSVVMLLCRFNHRLAQTSLNKKWSLLLNISELVWGLYIFKDPQFKGGDCKTTLNMWL